jgi:phosphonoacetaldehyde hydrolase
MNKIRACIFDLGGTLFDKYSLSPLFSLHNAFQKYNIDIPKLIISEDMGLKKQTHIETILDKPNVKPLWYRETGDIPKSILVDHILHEFNQLQSKEIQTCEIIPETKRCLRILKNHYDLKFGTTTGFNKQHTDRVKNLFRMNNIHIDNYVSSDCIENSRPFPDMIFKNMNDLNISNPKHIIKIDDTDVGIQEGINSGCWTIGVAKWSINMNMFSEDLYEDTCDFNTIQERLITSRKDLSNADYVIDTLDELPNVINRINVRLKK